jgi:acetyltransferase EpsM
MLLYGASGHGKVVYDVLNGEVELFFDDNDKLIEFLAIPVQKYDSGTNSEKEIIITIGDNGLRYKVSKLVKHKFGQVIAASSTISTLSRIGIGSQILQGAIVQTDAFVGDHVIINTGASVDHDCVIGNFCHIAPQVTLCGNVQVGEGTLIGAGSTIIPGIKIGKWCTIGAGTVVINDIPDYAVVVGNPGKIIKINQS